MKSGPRLTPFLHGRIVGMAKLGAKAKVIAEKARKKNKRRPSLQAVYILAKAKANPEWDGEEDVREGAGRPPLVSPALAQKDEEEGRRKRKKNEKKKQKANHEKKEKDRSRGSDFKGLMARKEPIAKNLDTCKSSISILTARPPGRHQLLQRWADSVTATLKPPISHP